MHRAYTAAMTSTAHAPAALRERMLSQLPAEVRDVLARIAAANAAGHTYAVGGMVRDLLLGRTIVDVDLATEGDAILALRRAVPETKLTAHTRFRTATTRVGDIEIDVVTARSEIYVRPGSLPHVAPSTIDHDLRRRDFSMNAIALRLDDDAILLDPCNGVDDINARLVRVLHPRSFDDDPTRMFRAVRYAERLGFSVESQTESLLTAALPSARTVSPARLRREIELMLLESDAGDVLEAADKRGLLRAIHPRLKWDDEKTSGLAQGGPQRIARLPFGFALLASRVSREEAAAVIDRLRLTRDEAAAVTATATMRDLGRTLRRPDAKPSGIVLLLEKFPAPAIAAYAATADDTIARQLALRYLEEWRHVKPLLRGDALAGMGVPTGPLIKRGLQLIRAARLDGWANDKGDERALALRFAKSIRDSTTANAEIKLHSNGH